jgi:hypothetical protein
LLDAAEEDLRQDKSALKVGTLINNHKTEKRFDVTISDDDLTFERKRTSTPSVLSAASSCARSVMLRLSTALQR